MSQREQLAPAADEDIAEAVSHRGVKQRDIRLDCGQHNDRVSGLERIVDDLPVGAMSQHVAADQTAQRRERNPFLRGLQRRVDRGAGGLEHTYALLAQRCSEAWCCPELRESYRRGLDGR